MDHPHKHTFRCTAEVCGDVTYEEFQGKTRPLPTRDELVAESRRQLQKREADIAAMRRLPK